MYNVPYYNPQASIDRINSQIAELEKLKQQIPAQPIQPTNLTQNFQLASNSPGMRYADSIDDVEKTVVIGDTPFFSKDMSIVWVKNTQSQIRTYELTEIVQKDDKDLMIESLQIQLDEMKGMIENAKSNDDNADESAKDEKSKNVSNAK